VTTCHLVLQGYGRDDFRTQAAYAAWSALAWRGDVPLAVHVYTDAPALLAPLGGAVEARVVGLEEIRAWRGPHGFDHRFKAEMIRDVARRHPGGTILYLDADAFLVAPLARVVARIGPGAAVLHEREYRIATHDTPQMRRFRRRMGEVRFEGAPLELDVDMWNAGAIGLAPGQLALLDRWIGLVDAIYPVYPSSLSEQYAISLLLQRAGRVSGCAEEVFHYWFQKEEYGAAILRELEVLAAGPLDAALAHLRAHRLALPPPARRRHRTTLLGRLARAFRR
jgi:hypothetical protein